MNKPHSLVTEDETTYIIEESQRRELKELLIHVFDSLDGLRSDVESFFEERFGEDVRNARITKEKEDE